MFAMVFSILVAALFLALVSMILLSSVHNRLRAQLDRCTRAFDQLNVHIGRRHELLLRLVEHLGARGELERALQQEAKEKCQAAKAAAQAAGRDLHDQEAMAHLIGAEVVLDDVVRRVFKVIESSQQLSADEQVRCLRDELVATESRFEYAREAYNEFAAEYNTQRDRFPARPLAAALGFQGIWLFGSADVHAVPQGDVKP